MKSKHLVCGVRNLLGFVVATFMGRDVLWKWENDMSEA